MNDMGKFIFLHFEKVLVGVFLLGLIYSLVWFGPWKGGTDYDAELEKLLADLDSRAVIDSAPSPPDLAAQFLSSSVPQQAMLNGDLIRQLTPIADIDVLPPADVLLRSNRGYVAVNWQLNPNSTRTSDTLQLVGVQVERTVLSPQGNESPYENRTKLAPEREYMTPNELYAIAQKVAAITLKQEKSAIRRASSETTKEAPYTIDDLFNAFHDGVITKTRLLSLVSEGIRSGYYSAEDGQMVNETFMGITMMMRESRQATRARAGSGGQPARRASPEELMKLVLDELGYRGGGNYVKYMTLQEGGSLVNPDESSAAPQSTAAKPDGKETGPAMVTFSEITIFVDTAVNPDLEYKYRVKFWAVDSSGTIPQLRNSPFVAAAGMASPKPDTEFFFTGPLPEQNQNKACITVRKWMYASNNWEVKNYFVAPGEQIGRLEIIPKKDTAGRVLTDNNRLVTEAVDFSTGCILLDCRVRPKVSQTKTSVAKADGTTINIVDSIDYVLYDTPQIVFSDRKGVLRVKWRGSVGAS